MSKKHKPANSNGDAASPWQKFKTTWEYRSLKFLLKILGIFLFVTYLYTTIPTAVDWTQIKYTQSQSLDDLPTLAEKYIADNRADKLQNWIAMRDKKDIHQIIDTLEPYSGQMESTTFLIYARRLAAINQKAEAVFWYQYSLYRLRFDAMRCGTSDAIPLISSIADIAQNTDIEKALETDETTLPLMIERVLEFDATHPAENDPQRICRLVEKLSTEPVQHAPRDSWPTMRKIHAALSSDQLRALKQKTALETAKENTEDDENATEDDAPAGTQEQTDDTAP